MAVEATWLSIVTATGKRVGNYRTTYGRSFTDPVMGATIPRLAFWALMMR